MRKHSTTYTHGNASLRRLYVLFAGAGAVSLGCVLGCAGADFEGDGSWDEAEYGQSEQALRKQIDIGRDIAVGELEPGNPDPPPPPPEPGACEIDPQGDLIDALGYRILTAFGRVDPGVWECVPGAPLCNAVRLSAALRNADSSPAYLAKVAKVDEFVSYMTGAGAMSRFANAYQTSRDYCAANACKTTPFAFEFEPGTPNPCGEVNVKISRRSSIVGDIGGVLVQAGSLNAKAARSGASLTKGAAAVFSLASQRAASGGSPDTGGSADTGGGAGSSGTPSTTVATTSAAGVLFTFYGLYGHRGPCPQGTESCNATGSNTVIKTYLDHTCEGRNPSDPSDVCYKAAFDAPAANFSHNLVSSTLAAAERAQEHCVYWKTLAMFESKTGAAFGSIQKRAGQLFYSCQ